jgi:hypothetical protein
MFGADKVAHEGASQGRAPWGDPFEPDALLPTDFFATFRPQGGCERERLLLFAVLADAVECYQKYAHDPRSCDAFTETEEWLNSEDRSSLFAFETLCDALGIEPDYLRRGLREWRARHAAARTERPRTRAGARAAGADAPPGKRSRRTTRLRVARCRPPARSR